MSRKFHFVWVYVRFCVVVSLTSDAVQYAKTLSFSAIDWRCWRKTLHSAEWHTNNHSMKPDITAGMSVNAQIWLIALG